MLLIEDAIIKSGKITAPVICDYILQLLASWVTVHRRFLPYHIRISFQNQALAFLGYDLGYTGSWFSSGLRLQIWITAVKFKRLLSTHLHFCPHAALWQLFEWHAETDHGSGQVEKEHRKKKVLFQLHL